MIEARGVHFSYRGGKPVLIDVDMKVRSGGFHALIGPNGSGKSTLLKVMCGTLRPSNGSIMIFGRPMGELSRKEFARTVSVLPQESGYGFDYTVSEIVWMGRYPHSGFLDRGRENKEAVRRAMEVTGTLDFSGRPYSELSGGERQKVNLARAMAQEPRLLILDEPTKDLDLKSSLDLMDTLARLNHFEGLTVLAVIHDLALAFKYFRTVTMLKDGNVVTTGSVEKALTGDSILEVFGVNASVERIGGRVRISV